MASTAAVDTKASPDLRERGAYARVWKHFFPVLVSLQDYAAAHRSDIGRFDSRTMEVIPEPNAKRVDDAFGIAKYAATSELAFREALAKARVALDAGEAFTVIVPRPGKYAGNPVERLANAAREAMEGSHPGLRDPDHARKVLENDVKRMRLGLGDGADLARPVAERLRDALAAEIAMRYEQGKLDAPLPIEVVLPETPDAEVERICELSDAGKCLVIWGKAAMTYPGLDQPNPTWEDQLGVNINPALRPGIEPKITFLKTDGTEFTPEVPKVAAPAHPADHFLKPSADGYAVKTKVEIREGLTREVFSNLDGPCLVAPGIERWGYMGKMFKDEQEFRDDPKVKAALEARMGAEGPR